jgi:predicted KAP-like P-loop ATPase
MARVESYTFRDDLPKDNPWQDDRLGYKPFCERLAKIISNLKVPNGYVVGLHGQWGSGKSTALNFVRAFLDKYNQETDNDKITLIDFRPWIVSGHQDLVAAFFKVMTDSLGSRLN